MRRKLIKQGSGLTVYVPKKWVDSKQLKAGDELEIEELEENLLFSTQHHNNEPKTLTLRISKEQHASLRSVLSNAYRNGFDKISLTFEGDAAKLSRLVQDHLLGFDVFEKKPNLYSIESVAEPSYDNFENIVQKQFFLILDLLATFGKEGFKENVYKVQRYDNFLKRSLTKQIFTVKSSHLLWQFLTTLVQAARLSLHLHQYIIEHKLSFDETAQEIVAQSEHLLRLVQKSYNSKKIEYIHQVRAQGKEVVYTKGPLYLTKTNPVIAHYLLYITRLIYSSASPLSGVLMSSSKTTVLP